MIVIRRECRVILVEEKRSSPSWKIDIISFSSRFSSWSRCRQRNVMKENFTWPESLKKYRYSGSAHQRIIFRPLGMERVSDCALDLELEMPQLAVDTGLSDLK